MRKLLAAAGMTLLVGLAAGCGAASSPRRASGTSAAAAPTASSPQTTARPRQAHPISSARHASCVRHVGYGGLGAASSLFDANNNGSTGPAEPTPGAAWYQVLGTARGCVTAYSVQDSAAPPLGDHDLLALVSPYLPPDAKQVATTRGCAVWKSTSLQRATGLSYARATAIAQVGSLMAGTAVMRATSRATC